MPSTSVNGINLYYELYGSPDTPVLVMNNGILMNASTSWIHQRDVLARQYRIMLYDCRGQGQSDHPATDYSMQQHADDLAGLLEHLDIPDAHIAGISYGGELSLVFAVNFPEKTNSLILADTVSEIQPDLHLVVSSWRAAAHEANSESFYNLTIPWNFSAGFIAQHPGLFAQTRKRYEMLDFPAVARLCDAFLQFDFSAQLGKIRCPTCIIVGDLDRLKGIEYAKRLQEGIPQAELHIILGAGHASCWEKPEEFNTILLGFLAKQKVSTAQPNSG